MLSLRTLSLMLCLGSLLINGCSSSMLGKTPLRNISEQLYIDARRDFSINHPLAWQRLQIPVSSPEFREDTARWEIKDEAPEDRGTAEMLIRSQTANPQLQPADLLSNFLSSDPGLLTGQAEEIELSAGPALSYQITDNERGRQTIALKGQTRDFIIALDSPAERFAELRPTFMKIVKSFIEVPNSEQ